MKHIPNWLALFLALAMMLGLFTACGGSAQSTSPADSQAASASSPEIAEDAAAEPAEEESAPADTAGSQAEAQESAEPEEPEELVPAGLSDAPGASMTTSNTELYPLDTDVTLTYWGAIDTNNLNYLKDGDIRNHHSWQVAQEQIGVSVDCYFESMMTAGEKASVLIAAGDLYDIMPGFTSYYPGGGEKALEDGYLYNALDYEDYVPNYLDLVRSDPDVYARVVTDEGSMPCLYHLVDRQVGPGNGSYVRKDWLDALGLDVPVTIEDWENTLLAFKDAYDPKYPYLLDYSGFNSGHAIVSAYGVAASNFAEMNVDNPWYQIDGKVYYGMNTDGLKEYLTLMHKWYEEGLISTDFTSFFAFEVAPDFNDAAANDAGIWNGFETIDTRWNEVAKDPNFEQLPITDPVLKEGDTLHFSGRTSMVDRPAYVVTTSCDNPEIAFAFCNYWYTYDGYVLCNFGLEGEGMEINEKGLPQYTDMVLNPEEGMTVSMAQFLYSVNFMSGLYDMNRAVSYDIGCRPVWGSNRDNAYDLPYSNLSLTADESSEYNTIMSDINTFVSERVIRFITGEADLAEWDSFVAQISDMDIETATGILQDAYDRYLAR